MIHIPVCFLVWKGADRRREVWERRGRDVTPIRLGRSKPRYRPVCHLVSLSVTVTWFLCLSLGFLSLGFCHLVSVVTWFLSIAVILNCRGEQVCCRRISRQTKQPCTAFHFRKVPVPSDHESSSDHESFDHESFASDHESFDHESLTTNLGTSIYRAASVCRERKSKESPPLRGPLLDSQERVVRSPC
jgi:hypothetical protein